MITVPALAADALGGFLSSYMERRFGSSEARLVELVPSIAGSRWNASATATRSITTSSTPCW